MHVGKVDPASVAGFGVGKSEFYDRCAKRFVISKVSSGTDGLHESTLNV